ncbi:MAG TPA: glycosyltransferase [Acidimicrobiia bacterium]|nr:glycosyltransferase [Acidimicrobiia bacterium]
MRTTVVVSPWNLVTYPQGGGHWWVPLQYVLGLRELGVDVWWMEQYSKAPGDDAFDRYAIDTFRHRMDLFGLGDRCIVWRGDLRQTMVGGSDMAEELAGCADLLLNFNYELPSDVVDRFAKSALVDIDPGLFQFWVSEGQVAPTPHDYYVTVGETVGTERARFPDLGVDWVHIRPPVCLSWWPVVDAPPGAAFTTVSGWWSGEWISSADGTLYDNNKRAAFLRYLDLPSRVSVPLELALNLGVAPRPGAVGPDDGERNRLLAHGWQVRHSYEVAGDPTAYGNYIRASRGEFSAVKPSCRHFQNAWISDRTVCYLASGRPAIVEDTGASEILPDDEGLFRFRSLDEAVRAFELLEREPDRHAKAARALAERHFDATKVLTGLLEAILG